jgi:nucleoside-diphosphate-sugar epimerase
MKIAITGSTGFVGSHLAARYNPEDVVHISRANGIDIDDVEALTRAFEGVDVVAHCAGINRELGRQTYQRVHVQGTHNVVEAAKRAGVKKILFMSFVRARPNCGSEYHESKWAAEELVRNSGLDYTVLKAGMTFGKGDHMLDHLSHTFYTLPFLPTVGFKPKGVRPLPIDDLLDVMVAAAAGELSRQSPAILGADTMTLAQAVKQVARVVGRRIAVFPIPVWPQMLLANIWEATMVVPLAAKAQIRILAEGLTEPAPWADSLPEHLVPRRHFTDEIIRAGLPEPGPFGLHDLLLFKKPQPK